MLSKLLGKVDPATQPLINKIEVPAVILEVEASLNFMEEVNASVLLKKNIILNKVLTFFSTSHERSTIRIACQISYYHKYYLLPLVKLSDIYMYIFKCCPPTAAPANFGFFYNFCCSAI